MRLPQREVIDGFCAACAVHLDEWQRERLRTYFILLHQWQQHINLTAVKDPRELLQFHFFEAFWASHALPAACSSFADVGSGGGFPGVAMKLYRPELSAVLIEKRYKKALFLAQLADRLSLDIEVFHGKGEAFSHWPSIRIATMRALHPSQELLNILVLSGTGLLLFHGKSRPQLEAWSLVESRKFPLSKNRWISIYAPPGTSQSCFT